MSARFIMVCLLSLGACTARAPDVEFAATPITPAEISAWSAVTVRIAHREITVRRTITTSEGCRDLEADVVHAGSDVVLRVSATATGEECPPGEGLWGYLAEIRGLPPGRYNLRVVHNFADRQRASEVVLSQPVAVQ